MRKKIVCDTIIYRQLVKSVINQIGGSYMEKYVCVCGYVYDPELGDPDQGIEPGTPFEALPEDWVCPLCGLAKDVFQKEEN